MPNPTVIVLASGRGERFAASGGKSDKLRSMLCGKSVIQHTLDAVKASGLPWHLEDAGHSGMGDSIAAAIAATEDADGWLILPGDLPLIRSETIGTIAQHLTRCNVVVPTHHGVRGHPVGFGLTCRQDLLALQGKFGAASVIEKYACLELSVDDIGIVTDIDTVQDLAHAEELLVSMHLRSASTRAF